MDDVEFERELIGALPYIEKITKLYIHKVDDWSDAVQETALRAWARRRQFRGECKFSSWAHTITRNVVIDTYRRKKAGIRGREIQMPPSFDAIDEKPQPVYQEDWHSVKKVLPTLNEQMRAAITIRLGDLKEGSSSTNKVRYHRAVIILRSKLCGRQRRPHPHGPADNSLALLL